MGLRDGAYFLLPLDTCCSGDGFHEDFGQTLRSPSFLWLQLAAAAKSWTAILVWGAQVLGCFLKLMLKKKKTRPWGKWTNILVWKRFGLTTHFLQQTAGFVFFRQVAAFLHKRFQGKSTLTDYHLNFSVKAIITSSN